MKARKCDNKLTKEYRRWNFFGLNLLKFYFQVLTAAIFPVNDMKARKCYNKLTKEYRRWKFFGLNLLKFYFHLSFNC